MLKVAITGNIGTGKTSVCKIFESLGIKVYYADKEAKLLYKRPEVIEQVIELFGKDVFDSGKNLITGRLAALVFNDQKKLKQLNNIIHPLVLEDYLSWTSKHGDKGYTLYESALLFESGFIDHFDKNILIISPYELTMKRVMERDGISKEEFTSRADKQIHESQKITRSDFIIHNDGSKALIPQVISIHKLLTAE